MRLHHRGGPRPGSGRRSKYGEPTRTMRVPLSRMAEVEAYLSGREPHRLTAVQDVVTRWREDVRRYYPPTRPLGTTLVCCLDQGGGNPHRAGGGVRALARASFEAAGAANAPKPILDRRPAGFQLRASTLRLHWTASFSGFECKSLLALVPASGLEPPTY
jgi:hypothetical protein